jgi:CrcB protein
VGKLLLVCAGGAFGSGARFLVATWAARTLGADFPRGTLLVNVSGSFLLTLLVAVTAGRAGGDDLRLALGAGVLGGYTTYSSFNAEVLALAGAGRPWAAAGYAAATVVLGLAAGAAGLAAGRALST